MNPLRLVIELIKYAPGRFSVSFVTWTLIHASPIFLGLLIGTIFDRLADGDAAVASPWTPVAIFATLAVGRQGALWVGDIAWIRYWNEQSLQLRRNLLRWMLEAPGSRPMKASPGQAVSTFRDDVEDLVEYVENWVDSGIVVFAIGATWVMYRIDPALTGLVLIPLVLTVVLTQSLSGSIRNRRRAMRAATESVTGFIGEMFGAVQAVKLADASEDVLDRFDDLNEVRRVAALRDTFLTELLRSINVNMATIGMGIVLIVAAGKIGSPRFSVGDLTIFLTYLPRLTHYMAFAGDIIAQHRRAGVSFERIQALAVDAPDSALLDRTRVPLDGTVSMPTQPEHATGPFRSLEVEHLAYVHVDDSAGVADISFEVEAGEFVVITGKIGSGKSTLLRCLLGLLPSQGTLRWNGEVIDDPASFLVPPRTAYTSQVPRLFSDTLGANIALGRHVTQERLREAVSLAVLDPDVSRLERGMDTPVGARGVKLSGGQVQRSAAARMFATEAELLILDDLSSALDVHTESTLWRRLFERRDVTCLVVSHRHAVLERADRILLLEGGHIVDRGTLAELLDRSVLMRDLWASPID